ncbi:hypothetical protein TRFO_21644 [Tritrichomonas foetus]|uniref:RRM domain-containing protein n=1 Tax=Tritrichomonas foetus TaxID=1144522 RepID=A0A1J4KDA6_9EUKA|nr:hypothetical protein TRFO_21644 [Tritrichomonas foetus]|eukprot:OHT09417.1 hypothetical protein TRFO_21644 [Tritrichomonas foetus]
MSFCNYESIVVISRNDINLEGIECIFGACGNIRNLFKEQDKSGKFFYWIGYYSRNAVNRALDLDDVVVAGDKIKVEPATFLIRKIKNNYQKKPENLFYSSSSDYTDDEASKSGSEGDHSNRRSPPQSSNYNSHSYNQPNNESRNNNRHESSDFYRSGEDYHRGDDYHQSDDDYSYDSELSGRSAHGRMYRRPTHLRHHHYHHSRH